MLLPAIPTQPWAACLVCTSPHQGEVSLAIRQDRALLPLSKLEDPPLCGYEQQCSLGW